jgi:hypothetical protein
LHATSGHASNEGRGRAGAGVRSQNAELTAKTLEAAAPRKINGLNIVKISQYNMLVSLQIKTKSGIVAM